MPGTKNPTKPKAKSSRSNPFQLRKSAKPAPGDEKQVHIYGKGFRCDTDTRGHAIPGGQSPLKIVVDASEGFIPLWVNDMTLRWRFREHSMNFFESPAAAKAEIRKLLGEALLAWGDSTPVKFAERTDNWDFEIVMRQADDCDPSGCVLASAFFPDAGRHNLTLYPQMFAQSREEQIETLVHEIGHAFGLRHFFANLSETDSASEIFGVHKPLSIMNYGSQSHLTNDDKADLKRLYQKAWSGELTKINGTPIRLVKPFHTLSAAPENMVALQPKLQPQGMAPFFGNG
jgi:hypothetical protein